MALDVVWIGGDRVTDIDAAWDNSAAVEGSADYGARWASASAVLRDRLGPDRVQRFVPYGDVPRQHYDLLLPEGDPAGLVVFVHGGYWKSQEIANWSYLAAGPLAHGFAVALPEYTLCPEATVPAITREIGAFLDHVAGTVGGPINLAGHSAGGHLVTRMLCRDAPVAQATAGRIGTVVSISGVHDLRGLLTTAMNAVLGLDLPTARAESPALLEPRGGIDLTCVAGGAELAEFRRQSALLANIWHGFGVRTAAAEIPGRHHFDVVDDVRDADSELVALLTRR